MIKSVAAIDTCQFLNHLPRTVDSKYCAMNHKRLSKKERKRTHGVTFGKLYAGQKLTGFPHLLSIVGTEIEKIIH